MHFSFTVVFQCYEIGYRLLGFNINTRLLLPIITGFCFCFCPLVKTAGYLLTVDGLGQNMLTFSIKKNSICERSKQIL